MPSKPYGRLEAKPSNVKITVGDPRRSESRPLIAFALLFAGTLAFLSLASFTLQQPFYGDRGVLSRLMSDGQQTDANLFGKIGATFAVLALNAAGWGAFIIPLGLFVCSYYALFNRAHAILPWKLVFLTVTFLSFTTLCSLFISPAEWTQDRFAPSEYGVGGSIGHFLYERNFKDLLGAFGSGLTIGVTFLVCACGIFIDDPRRLIAKRMEAFRAWTESRKEEARRKREIVMEMRRKQAEARAEALKKIVEAKAKSAPVITVDEPVVVDAKTEKAVKGSKGKKAAAAVAAAALADSGTAAAVNDVGPALADEIPGDDFPEETPAPAEAIDDFPDAAEPDTAAADGPSGIDEFGEVSDKPASASVATGTVVAKPSAPLSSQLPPPPMDTPPPSEFVKPVAPAPKIGAPSAVPQAAATGKLTIVAEESVEKVAGSITPKTRGAYHFPPVSLLNEPPPAEKGPGENYEERAETLIRTLGEFKIKVTPGDVQSGPVITRYEVLPAAGVRVEKISGLANNIAMNLKAESVRVLAPVPGKGTVGIEVPNRRPKPVSLREIIESKVWAENKCDIPVVLGKDVTGKPIVADLAKMPHALIAGSTGSGKSVCINGIIASLLYHASPDDLRFIMVDPKVVEMQIYNKLPHMLIPVVTECKKVPGALKWLITEMERRYRIFAKTNVKNIAGFNAKIGKDKDAGAKAAQLDLSLSPEERVAASQAVNVARDEGVLEIPDKKLPYIVCIIDELADLMMVAPADIETGIARLAQLARAAGIHLILATQRPSVNVITGVIKANLPCRIAFKVTSVIDSRTILDGKGAESLIGKGDMLFIPPGAAALVRAQGAFVSETEVEELVEYINRENGDPEFADDVQEAIELAAMEDGDDGKPTEGTDDPNEDPMIAKSWEIIRSTKRASTSMLQRRLSIGYNRAARIMDILQERGYVGPENGSSPREILKEV